MCNASPVANTVAPSGETAPTDVFPARQNLLDNIFARIAVISISFGAAGGFCPDYPIIQIPLSRGRRATDKTPYRRRG